MHRLISTSAVLFTLCGNISTVSSLKGGLWDLFDKPRDCTFTHWGPWEGCVRNRFKGVHEHKRTRGMQQPENNGKPCPAYPVLTDIQKCKSTEVLADQFLAQVHSPSYLKENVMTDLVARCTGNLCTAPDPCRELRDANGTLILAGGDCPSLKQKRSISGKFVTPRRMKRTTTERNRDILFLLDESGSVGSEDFKIVKRIAAVITEGLCGNVIVKKDRTRISAASFDSTSYIHFYLKNEYINDGPRLADKIRNIQYQASTDHSTCLGDALLHAHKNMFTEQRGARLNSDEDEQMIILITDGCANCAAASLKSIAAELYEDNISILTIFIGDESDGCRETLKELGNNVRCWELFPLDNFENADKFADLIEEKVCMLGIWEGFGESCHPPAEEE